MPTRLAKTVRRAEEGVGAREIAERFFRKRIEEGRGTVDGLCLAIPSAKDWRTKRVSVELSGIGDHLERRGGCSPLQTMGGGMVGTTRGSMRKRGRPAGKQQLGEEIDGTDGKPRIGA